MYTIIKQQRLTQPAYVLYTRFLWYHQRAMFDCRTRQATALSRPVLSNFELRLACVQRVTDG